MESKRFDETVRMHIADLIVGIRRGIRHMVEDTFSFVTVIIIFPI